MAQTNSTNSHEEQIRRFEADRIELNSLYADNTSKVGVTSQFQHKNSIKSQSSITFDIEDLEDRTDKYGFIHDHKLPKDLTESEKKKNNIEKLREKKWIAMLKDWHNHYSPLNQRFSDKLVGRIFKGIPNALRQRVWANLLDVKMQINTQPGVYEKMKNLAREYSLDLRQIDLDINRTFRDNIAFRQRYCPRQVQLYNVLAAYSLYNSEMGYCQGMSNITALLLMYLSDEETTFWALSQLMSNSKYSMHGFYKQDFPKLIRYSDKHDFIIKTLLPKVYKKFKKSNITSLLYTTKWFLQCYLDALPFSLVLRIWDVYLLKGDIAMLAMSYCILRMHKRTLLKLDMDGINEFLKKKLREKFGYSDDDVILKLHDCIDDLKRFNLIDKIPENELPKLPFGQFKKFDKQALLATNKNSSLNAQDRDTLVEQLAQKRLEEARQKRLERMKRKQTATLTPGDGEAFGFNDGGKPIKNISDSDDDDDDDNLEDYDEDNDDLNPSKLSEYDDDYEQKHRQLSEKESMNSRQSSSQISSIADLQSQLSLDIATSLAYNNNASNGTTTTNNNTNGGSPVKTKKITLFSKRVQSNNNIVSRPTAPFKSNEEIPIDIKLQNGAFESIIVKNNDKNMEYVRSPNGIYAPLADASTTQDPSFFLHHQQQPPTFNKRTTSLRNITYSNNAVNKNITAQNDNPQVINNNNGYSTTTTYRLNTPTKLQLQNHSLRIASIQQQQQNRLSAAIASANGNNNFSTMSIISQAPTTMTKNGKINGHSEEIIEQYDYI